RHPLLYSVILALLSLSALPVFASSISKSVLPNGLTVIVKPEESSGIVAVEVFIKAGAAEERESNAGIGNLVARTLLASTRNRRAETVAAVIDAVGGNFQTEWHPDYTEIKVITTKAGFDSTTSILGDILNNAKFEQKWVDRAREEILTEIVTQGDDVFQTSYEQVRMKLYQDNPYHRPTRGYVRSLRSITVEDLQRFYQQYYVPNNIVVCVVGDVTPERVLERMKIAFAGTSSRTLPRLRPIPAEELKESKSELLERPIDAAYFLFGFLAPSVTSEDYPAMRVTAAALGSGKGSRMFRNLRETKGLAYELGTIYPTMKNQSHVLAYLVTDPYRRVLPGFSIEMMLEEVKQATLDEVSKLQKELLTPQELERAKQYTIGTYALQHQRLRDRAFHLGWLETIGLGCEYDLTYASKIEAVTAQDVQRVAKKYLNNYVMTIVLPETFEKDSLVSKE
ncbi:MAG TPA: pitrilysin family protein, partial [Armatimonadota bacterium]|nr:pitrilysin family protein [Armatimonadota bacterium]